MRFCCIFVFVTILPIWLELVLAESEVLHGRRSRGSGNKAKKSKYPGCIWQFADCVPTRGRCGRGTQKGTLVGDNCPSKKKQKRCKLQCREESSSPGKLSPSDVGLVGETVGVLVGRNKKKVKCRYDKGEWSPCDSVTDTISRTLVLKKGDPSVCQPSRVLKKKCRKECKYNKSEWSDCNLVTHTRTRALTLKRGNASKCEKTKVLTRSCKRSNSDRIKKKKKNGKNKIKNNGKGKRKNNGKRKKNRKKKVNLNGCKYRREPWDECSPVTGMRSRSLILKKGDPAKCDKTKTIVKKCRKACRYSRGPLEPCNPQTNERSRTLTLRKGDPNQCEATKVIHRKCKKACRYSRGKWSSCDPATNIKQRLITLKTGSHTACNKTETISKRCKRKTKSDCKYDVSQWSACDPATKQRSRTKTLVRGNPTRCHQTKVITRSCLKNNGEARCFFGPWGDFSDCQNGVMKKMRPVLSGPEQCQRKAVKMRPC